MAKDGESEQTTTPRLRFPKFRDEWRECMLSTVIKEFRASSTVQDEHEVFTSARRGLMRQVDYYGEGRITERDNVGFNVIPADHITYRSRTDDGRFYFNHNDLGVTGIISIYYPVFHSTDGSNTFIASLLNHFSMSIGTHSVGTSQRVLPISKLMRIRLPIPSPAEQRRIADCLKSLDELIAAQERQVAALSAHKRALMQQLFPREGETRPRLRFPEFGDAKEWIFKPLSQAADNLDNKRVPITEKDRTKGNVPYYGASGIVDYVEDHIFDEDLLCVSEDGANLVTRTYPIAFAISGKTWVNNHAHVLRFEKMATQKIVETYLNAIDLGDFITGMAQPKLNRAMLDSIPIPLPEQAEQQRVADCLTALDAQIAAASEKLAALKVHKQGLMQQLFPSAKAE